MSALFWFVIVITPIVLVHELGHFLFAKAFGVKVEVFSIGFGKALFKWKDSKDTIWQIALIPLGGFVKMYGDQGVVSTSDIKQLTNLSLQEKKLFLHTKKLWQKSLIVFGGPFANYLLTFLIFVTISMCSGVKEIKTEITSIQNDSPAAKAGLKLGDVIVDVDGQKITSVFDLKHKIASNPYINLTIGFVRKNTHLNAIILPKEEFFQNILGKTIKSRVIGVAFENFFFRKVNFRESLKNSFHQCIDMSCMILKSIMQMLNSRSDVKNIGGPIKIAMYSENIASQGLIALLYFIAVLSLNLGFINLLPIPMLDGGHLFFYAIEAVIRRPINYKLQKLGFKFGFCVLIAVMLIAFWNDLKGIGLL